MGQEMVDPGWRTSVSRRSAGGRQIPRL